MAEKLSPRKPAPKTDTTTTNRRYNLPKSVRIPKFKLESKTYIPLLVLLLIVLSFLVGVLITKVQYLEKNAKTAETVQAQPSEQGAPVPGAKVEVSSGHLPALGNKDAKVEVVEFSDFQCPFCLQWFQTVKPELTKEYIDTGKIKFSYRQFPLTSIHPNAYKASSASECANEQGKFWEYHDILFQNQAAWSNLDSASAVAKFKEYAGTLGLNTGSFNSCLDSDKYKADIDKDITDATAAGANGTPATFINGIPVIGAQPYTAFKTLIDQELAK